jgi:hypothetical protein
MRVADLERLAHELDAVGAAPAIIRRTLQELEDHYEDAVAAARRAGLDRAAAETAAARSIGDLKHIVTEVAARPDLLSWRHRWPHAANCVNCASYCLLWPVSPFVYFVNHPAGIVRWSVSSSLAICVTGSILLSLHWMMRVATGL